MLLDEDMLAEIGMKKLQIKKFLRISKEWLEANK
jgi:hypothetical protein